LLSIPDKSSGVLITPKPDKFEFDWYPFIEHRRYPES